MFFGLHIKGQNKSFPEIDRELSDSYNTTHDNLTFEKGIIENKKLADKCKQLNYKNGLGTAYLNIANFSSYLTRYQESLKYLELSEKSISESDNYYFKVLLYIEYGKVYGFLNLYDISLTYYDRAIHANKRIPDADKKRHSLHYAYACKAESFTFLGRYDSTYVYFKKAYQLDPDPITASNVADYFIKYKKDQIDSARHYLDVGIQGLKTTAYEPYQKVVVLEKYGDYYHAKQDYKKALDYYFQSLELGKRIQKDDEVKYIYQLISETYKAMHDDENSAKYLLKYSRLNDSLSANNKNALNVSVEKLVRDKEKEKRELKRRNYYIVGMISLITIGLIICSYIFYLRKKKEKQQLIQSQKEEITQKDIEKRNLEHKVNDAFDEVLQLAKNNDPAFLARFKEVYPEFCKTILTQYPDILNSEFIFCAYLKLNFSTKEIANYTYVTEKAVQARKSRIRKKFNISSEEDLYIWFNKMDS